MNQKPGTIIIDRGGNTAYYYEDDGSRRVIPHAKIQDGKVLIDSLAVQARITYLQREYGSGD